MSDDSSGKRSGLFGRKGLSPNDVKVCIINKYDREHFFSSLQNYGWAQVEEPFEFERDWPEKKIRKAAREHAADIHADLLIEIRDRDYSTNPFNDFVFYVWRSGPNTRGLPPPPGMTQQPYNAQMQILAEQQRALIQQQQMLQRMQMQIQPQQPKQPQPQQGQPSGQCSRCGSVQIQYMANGMAKCIQCGFLFHWQAPQGQQPPQVPMQQPAPQSPQQQPQQQPQQIPKAPPQVQQSAPTPPGSRPCPKCGNPLNIFPDGSCLCSRCGYTGQ